MKPIATMITAALALVFQGAFARAHAVNASGHCTGMTVMDYISSDAADQTTSTNYVNISDGHLNFTTSAIGCVMITFSGGAFVHPGSNSSEFLHVRTLLDGSNLCAPADINDLFLSDSSPEGGSASSITRICKNVAAGAHSVQVQYRGTFQNPVFINGHVLTVTHN